MDGPVSSILKPLRIGTAALSTNLLLAPIAGYCDVAFRLVVRSCGSVGLACTDLLSPEGILRQTARTLELAQTCPEDNPLCIQLYGSNVDRLCEAARWAEGRGAAVVDINMGCPVDKVTKTDGGSKLLCDPDRTLRMVEKIKASLRAVPLTCKLRLGWDDTCIVAPYLARRLQDIGVAMITIHGRTTEMRFGGAARLDGIAAVVAAVANIPVVGNGDVKTPQDAEHMLRYTKCAGVMIGRGALAAPWIFHEIWTYLTTGVVPAEPGIERKVQLMRDHFRNLCHFRWEKSAIQEMRKRVSWYGKKMSPCKQMKIEMREITSVGQFEQVLTRFLDWRLKHDEEVRTGRRPAEADVEAAERVEAA